eukprot:1880122-Rhodomonas_salina.3
MPYRVQDVYGMDDLGSDITGAEIEEQIIEDPEEEYDNPFIKQFYDAVPEISRLAKTLISPQPKRRRDLKKVLCRVPDQATSTRGVVSTHRARKFRSEINAGCGFDSPAGKPYKPFGWCITESGVALEDSVHAAHEKLTSILNAHKAASRANTAIVSEEIFLDQEVKAKVERYSRKFFFVNLERYPKAQVKNKSISVMVESISGDPDLYMSTTHPPTEREYTWRSLKEGTDVIEILPSDPNYVLGVFYIAVYCPTSDCEFHLRARLHRLPANADAERLSRERATMYDSIRSKIRQSAYRLKMSESGKSRHDEIQPEAVATALQSLNDFNNSKFSDSKFSDKLSHSKSKSSKLQPAKATFTRSRGRVVDALVLEEEEGNSSVASQPSPLQSIPKQKLKNRSPGKSSPGKGSQEKNAGDAASPVADTKVIEEEKVGPFLDSPVSQNEAPSLVEEPDSRAEDADPGVVAVAVPTVPEEEEGDLDSPSSEKQEEAEDAGSVVEMSLIEEESQNQSPKKREAEDSDSDSMDSDMKEDEKENILLRSASEKTVLAWRDGTGVADTTLADDAKGGYWDRFGAAAGPSQSQTPRSVESRESAEGEWEWRDSPVGERNRRGSQASVEEAEGGVRERTGSGERKRRGSRESVKEVEGERVRSSGSGAKNRRGSGENVTEEEGGSRELSGTGERNRRGSQESVKEEEG